MEAMKTEVNNMQVVPKEQATLKNQQNRRRRKKAICYNTPMLDVYIIILNTILDKIKTLMLKVDGWIALYMT